ncbi:Leucine rich repeat containing protein [Euroglyphus maynei]|uniref:Leucine rich repeat containing protein n=1 Tax=Euroglyphus maynei TaxID=6958 RepID=A0A1Y3AZI9_EURMA|nr:Leucine rich repeat containing protein [Euroglyphus maynei]
MKFCLLSKILLLLLFAKIIDAKQQSLKPLINNVGTEDQDIIQTPDTTANDEEALVAEDSAAVAAVSHLIDRHVFHYQEWSSNLNYTKLLKNCSYIDNDLFCDCDLLSRTFICYNVQSVDQIRRSFDHLLNATRSIYWNRLEIHCVEPYSNDDPSTGDSSTTKQSTIPPNKSFHISYELFTDGPRFESILFVGDCSKPRHYDNLIAVDRDVQQIIMHRNMLRMSTSCSLFQPKFERLNELILKDCLVAGDMISSTFSTRCLGHYGTRNEPMQLSKLIISSCNISLIESGAFFNFAELELIDLSRNQITHLSRQAFSPHLYRLRTLKLDHNKLTSLNGEFFEKLPELREVLLSENRLTTLPFLPSAGPGVAQVLQLGENPWDCRCRLTWILEEPMDSVRLISDEPRCETPINFQNQTLFKGLQLVKQTFC